MRFLILCLSMVLLASGVTPASAQPPRIEYGKNTSGEITSAQQQAEFTFSGSPGDFVVIQLLPAVENGLIGGMVTVSDSGGQVVSDSGVMVVLGRPGEIIAVALRDTNPYTVKVSMKPGAEPVGKFEIYVDKAAQIAPGVPVEGVAIGATLTQRIHDTNFYVFQSSTPKSLRYERLGGDLNPDILIYTLESGNNLFPVLYMGGFQFLDGSMIIPGDPRPRVVSVGSLSFGAVGYEATQQTARFRLTLGQ